MERKAVVFVESQETSIVKVKLCVLGVSDTKQRVSTAAGGMKLQANRQGIQQVACRLYIKTERVYAIIISQAKAHLHYEKVFIIISQDGVSVVDIVKILRLESLTNPWHIDIVKVRDVETIRYMTFRR